MDSKLFAPWDGVREYKETFALVWRDLMPGEPFSLLHVIPRGRLTAMGELASSERREIEKTECPDVSGQFGSVVRRLGSDPDEWRCEQIEAGSLPHGIVDFSQREESDLVVLLTHDRRDRLAKLIDRSMGKDLERIRLPVEVEELGPAALATVP